MFPNLAMAYLASIPKDSRPEVLAISSSKVEETCLNLPNAETSKSLLIP